MESIGTRIKKLRDALHITQSEFAKKIGSVQNTITGYETGRREPSNQVIALICQVFRVNEEWLRTGKGEMFLPAFASELEKYLSEMGVDEMGRAIIRVYMELTPRQRDMVKEYILRLAGELSGEKQTAKGRPPDCKCTPEEMREIINAEIDDIDKTALTIYYNHIGNKKGVTVWR